MSGFEVIGGIVSIVQIVDQAVQIFKYLESLRTIVRQFKQYQQHLEGLISAVQVVDRSSLLRTDPIQSILRSILPRLETLATTLERHTSTCSVSLFGKLRNRVSASRVESTITREFNILEKEKSSLQIHITTTLGETLAEVRERLGLASQPTITMPSTTKSGIVLGTREKVDGKKNLPKPQTASNSKPRLDEGAARSVSGHTFYKNSAYDDGIIVNREMSAGKPDVKPGYWQGNCAYQRGRVLNGNATESEMKDFFRRS